MVPSTGNVASSYQFSSDEHSYTCGTGANIYEYTFSNIQNNVGCTDLVNERSAIQAGFLQHESAGSAFGCPDARGIGGCCRRYRVLQGAFCRLNEPCDGVDCTGEVNNDSIPQGLAGSGVDKDGRANSVHNGQHDSRSTKIHTTAELAFP